jgi:hypothetical protein
MVLFKQRIKREKTKERRIHMNARLIANDNELLIVFKVLLFELKKAMKNGKPAIFPPQKFVLPEEEIQIKDKPAFEFELEEAEIDTTETLRLLGVTLYHLVAGKSELTHESYLLDGYLRPLNSSLWPIVLLLLNKEESDIAKIEKMIDEINPEEIQPDIQPSQSGNAKGKTKKLDDILNWLNSEPIKIIHHDIVANFWGIVLPEDIQIRYSEETLRQSIEANKYGENWRLAFYSGQNPRQMRQKIGTDRNNQPCFFNNDWWLEDEEDFWADKNMEHGYYLLNFNGKFADKKWRRQEELKVKEGHVYERAHEFVVAETVISNFSIHGEERLLEDWYHWGKRIRLRRPPRLHGQLRFGRSARQRLLGRQPLLRS